MRRFTRSISTPKYMYPYFAAFQPSDFAAEKESTHNFPKRKEPENEKGAC